MAISMIERLRETSDGIEQDITNRDAAGLDYIGACYLLIKALGNYLVIDGTHVAGADTVCSRQSDGIFQAANACSQTTSSAQSLFLAMVLRPEVQRKAQSQLDAIVGPDRLPTFEDRPSLPYIEAIVRETLRWHMVLPLGMYQNLPASYST